MSSSAVLSSLLRSPVGDVMRFGMCGNGLFLRQLAHCDPEAYAKSFDFVCPPLIASARTPLNRTAAWYTKARSLGVTINGFDWLPAPNNWNDGLHDAIKFLASVGGHTFLLDAEASWKHNAAAATEYVAAANEYGAAEGVKIGFTSYGGAWGIREFPWRIFCERTEIAVPQTYDREGNYDPRYMPRSIKAYRDHGARNVVLGVGPYISTGDANEYRWRTAVELERHLALVPDAITGVLGWPLGGRIPTDVLGVFAKYTPPGMRAGLRTFVRNLLPFARTVDDC